MEHPLTGLTKNLFIQAIQWFGTPALSRHLSLAAIAKDIDSNIWRSSSIC